MRLTKIKLLVDRAGYTYDQLVAVSGVSRRRISTMLSPELDRIDLRFDTLMRIVCALAPMLDMTPREVFMEILEEDFKVMTVEQPEQPEE